MRRIAVDEIEPAQGPIDRRSLAPALGTEAVAINRYRVAPGEGLPGGLHAHMDQEEVFVVLEGSVMFETLDRDVTVEAGETVRFAPGEFQSGHNNSDDPAVLLGLGAPLGTDDVRIPVACPACGQPVLRISGAGGDPIVTCPDCSAEFEPDGCPECGAEMIVTVRGSDRDVVSACSGCGAEYDSPPFLY